MPRVHYFWDPISDNIVQERDDDGNLIAEYTTEPYLHGNLISQNRGGVESQYHYDSQGNTLALTNDNQEVTDTYGYNAFGEVTEHTGDTVNPFQYGGQKGYYRNEETGEYDVRRRQLSPRISLWLSPDPTTASNQVLKGYVYAANNPINLIDSSGLEPKLIHKPIGIGGCGKAELEDIRLGLKQACDFLIDPRGKRCLPPELVDCLAKVCGGTVMTKCIKECDPKKGHHVACAHASISPDGTWFSPPLDTKRCELSVHEDSTPVIEFCYTIKGAPGEGASNPKKCKGSPENAMQLIFHELMHFCGSKHTLDKRNKPIVEGDLIFGCMKKCFGVGDGDASDCTCC